MNEDPTKDLPGATPFEQRVLAEFAALNRRMTVLEDRVDARLRETRPIWEGVQTRLAAIEEAINDIRSQMKLVVKDLFKTRARVEDLEDRQRPPAA